MLTDWKACLECPDKFACVRLQEQVCQMMKDHVAIKEIERLSKRSARLRGKTKRLRSVNDENSVE